MSVSHIQPPRGRPAERLLTRTSSKRYQAPSARSMATRRVMLTVVKLGLPVLAVLLLTSIAVWPQIAQVIDRSRTAFKHAFAVEADTGRMLRPHYHGVDERGRPYTLTADWANQTAPGRIDMGEPKGDLVTESGNWLMVQSRDGVYMQHSGLLDLSTNVVLYRDDGTILRTETAATDVKQGAVSSDDKTHAEGPFGVLDAQGFMLTDKGAAIVFQGPAHLILSGSEKK